MADGLPTVYFSPNLLQRVQYCSSSILDIPHVQFVFEWDRRGLMSFLATSENIRKRKCMVVLLLFFTAQNVSLLHVLGIYLVFVFGSTMFVTTVMVSEKKGTFFKQFSCPQ
jgi:hypothetical protein